MPSSLPETPGRGRSRFSKVLPKPPDEPANTPKSPDSTSRSASSRFLHSPLPPLPKDAMPPTMSIPRRPVGSPPDQNALTKALSTASATSICSDSAGLLSDSSSITKDSLSGPDSETVTTPPIPRKHDRRQQSSNAPRTPSQILSEPVEAFRQSPPRPEIWRRRSVRSDRSVALPDLKLDKSNGSTAIVPKQEPPKGPLPQLPRNTSSQRKPVPARPAPPQPEFMGHKFSKLKEKNSISTLLGSDSRYEATTPKYPSNQPPTPEYLKADRKYPVLPTVLSPVSPDTPPDDTAPQISARSDSRNELGLNVPGQQSDPNSLTTPFFSHSRQSSDTLTITSPQPQPPTASKILSPRSSCGSNQASPLVLSPPANGLKIHFPKIASPSTPGAVLPALPLDEVHLDCYQSHKFMRGTKNQYCPIACMVCQKKDMEMRWRCSWCCLSACGPCMQVLASVPGKDLRICLERIGV